MSIPLRIQLKRTRGWRMPPDTVKVDRSTPWGNSYRVGDRYFTGKGFAVIRDAAMAVDLFRQRDLRGRSAIAQLRGKNLGCWCGLCDAHRDGRPLGVECEDCAPCHADVLLELANRPLASVADGPR